MTHPVVRLARPEDLPRLAELEQASFAQPWGPEALSELLASPAGLTLVAESDGAPLLGYALFFRAADEAELLRMGVTPEARSRGIGRALVAAGLATLESAGVVRVLLEVRPSNLAALRLYEGLGFRRLGRRPAYYADGEDALVYARADAVPS